MKHFFIFFLSLSLFTSITAFSSEPLLNDYSAREATFNLPVEGSTLRTAVDFWVKIYGTYSTNEGVIHDTKDLNIIYEAIDRRKVNIKAAKNKVRQILLKLHRLKIAESKEHYEELNAEEKRIATLFDRSNDRLKFLNAAHYKRLRFQLGQKDRIKEGIIESGRYLPFMEEIFYKEGLPRPLTRLPFVESSFNTRARSKVGASGIWQFMRATGREFIKINESVDERNDPLRATEAAAKLLKINFDSLKSWPLAVTAYNHGRTGLMRAVRRLGTDDLEEIIENNKARNFGFASSNFFACLLAAIEVEKNSEKYFGKMNREEPHFFYEVPLPSPVKLTTLKKFMGISLKSIEDLNPGLTERALKSKEKISKEYRLRLPLKGAGSQSDKDSQVRVFLAGFNKLPQNL